MQIIYPPHYQQHTPPFEIFNGQQTTHNEVPARIERILSALRSNGFKPKVGRVAPRAELDSVLARVHTPKYIAFLEKFCRSLAPDEHRYPSVFRYRSGRESRNPLAEFGNYSFDLYTPLSQNTYQIAYESAAIALEAAIEVQMANQKGRKTTSYALCRPPGHHAEREQMGGYCYFNNCAVAAEYLSQFGKVATLDVDFHHGNGTQAIFYTNDQVLTVSLHADPQWKFPFFSGGWEELGQGPGEGFNLNLPLPEGTTNEQYQAALEKALYRISEFSPQFLVISLGLDTHEADPIGGFKLTTEYYQMMAKSIAALDLPSVILQEGGYNTELLGKNVVAFLNGYIS